MQDAFWTVVRRIDTFRGESALRCRRLETPEGVHEILITVCEVAVGNVVALSREHHLTTHLATLALSV